MMYRETGTCDDEQQLFSLESAHSRPRFQPKFLGLGVVVFLVAACGGHAMWNREKMVIAVDSQVGLDLEESKIRIPIDVMGIEYGSLTGAHGVATADLLGKLATAAGTDFSLAGDTKKALFKKAIIWSITHKALIPVESATIAESDIFSSAAVTAVAGAAATPARTELVVVVTVPAQVTADALTKRLNEDGTLIKQMRANLLQHKSFVASDEVYVHFGAIGKAVTTKKNVFETEITPLIVMEMEVRGVDYAKLAGDSALQTGFVDAVQRGVAHGSVTAKNVGLDIQNGGKTNNVPFVHLTAKFPVPAGMKADATMSEWPSGSAGIGSAVQKNVRAIANINVASQDSTGGHHVITVLAGSLHLGAVREMFNTEVHAEFEVKNMIHGAGVANTIKPDVVKEKILELVKKQVGVDKDVVAVYSEGKTEAQVQAATTIRVLVKVSAQGEQASQKASDWQAKFLPAAAAVKKYFKDKNPLSVTPVAPATFQVMVESPEVKQTMSSIDLDVVIHGIDYDNIAPGSKGAFLSDLAKAMRTSISNFHATAANNNAYLRTIKDDISLTVSGSQRYSNSINVRIHVPAPDSNVGVVTSELENNLDVKVKNKMLTEIKKMDGIKYVSSWTQDAIKVTIPSFIPSVQ